jgi:MurNAc alpha-1-phosphate uridylyltransferase
MSHPTRGMVLAAGLGTRMRPLTDTRPKPLVEVAGRALIDHVLDRLQAAEVGQVVVNVHHHADMLENHLSQRTQPHIIISDERQALLDSGGGIKKALPHLGAEPFFVMNADTIWREGAQPNLDKLSLSFDPENMDALLLLASTSGSIGYDGCGDFNMDDQGRLSRRIEGHVTPYVYAGAAILNPAAFDSFGTGAFSLNRLFDKAIGEGRLMGLHMDGQWMHVGTPQAVAEAGACFVAKTKAALVRGFSADVMQEGRQQPEEQEHNGLDELFK